MDELLKPRISREPGWLGDTTGSASNQQSTNDRKVAGSRPTKVECITVVSVDGLGSGMGKW